MSIFHTIALFHTSFHLSCGYVTVSLLVLGLPVTCENLLCPRGLLCVISGLLAAGSPGFRTVLCCFLSHKSCMASLFRGGSLFPCCLVALAIPILVNAKPLSFAVCYIWPPVACNVSLVLVLVLLFACFVSCLFCCVSCLVPFSNSLHDDGL